MELGLVNPRVNISQPRFNLSVGFRLAEQCIELNQRTNASVSLLLRLAES